LAAVRLRLEESTGMAVLLGKRERIAERKRSRLAGFGLPGFGLFMPCHATLSGVRISWAGTGRQMSRGGK
jgi:hypothetical protein